MKKLSTIWSIGYAALLIAFTAYALLDTFVISTAYVQVQDATEESKTLMTSVSKTNDTTATELNANDSVVSVETYREYDTNIYVATISADDITALKSAFADNTYGKNITAKTSEIAESVNALIAINGDYYGVQESGYVIRNGELYRSTKRSGQQDLVIYKDGTTEFIYEDDVTAEELVEKGAWQVLSFGPALLENSEISVSENDEVGKAMTSNPRTAIGFTENGDIVFVVSDGRTEESEGLSLYQLAEFMESIGIVNAYNLDGGGSSTMVYEGKLVNNPTTSGRSVKERSVSDILYIAQ